VVDDLSVRQDGADRDRGLILANAERLLRLLMTVPAGRDDALAVVNGFFGDRLADQGSALAIPMTLRSRTGALTLDRDSLAQVLPHTTGSIALLVHGLMASESIWEFPGDPGTTLRQLASPLPPCHAHLLGLQHRPARLGKRAGTRGLASPPRVGMARACPRHLTHRSQHGWPGDQVRTPLRTRSPGKQTLSASNWWSW
jgi:hypothetical protein